MRKARLGQPETLAYRNNPRQKQRERMEKFCVWYACDKKKIEVQIQKKKKKRKKSIMPISLLSRTDFKKIKVPSVLCQH